MARNAGFNYSQKFNALLVVPHYPSDSMYSMLYAPRSHHFLFQLPEIVLCHGDFGNQHISWEVC